MYRVALLLTCLLITSSAIAADNTQKQKKTKGTAVSAKKVVKPWEPTAFIQEGERLPVGYSGLDPKKFYAMFKSKTEGLKKDEFETSEEFAKRTENKDALLAPINTSDLYAFQKGSTYIKYDADAQAYTIEAFCEETYYSTNILTCKMAELNREHDTYTGGNAYGASVIVRRTRGNDFALSILNDTPFFDAMFTSSKSNKFTHGYKDTFSIPSEKARNLKDLTIGLLFIGRVTDAEIIVGRERLLKPEIDKPYDVEIDQLAVPFDVKKVVYYVIETGEVLGQKDF
jgi:hypothetical protein